jgi:hypothetical protein
MKYVADSVADVDNSIGRQSTPFDNLIATEVRDGENAISATRGGPENRSIVEELIERTHLGHLNLN